MSTSLPDFDSIIGTEGAWQKAPFGNNGNMWPAQPTRFRGAFGFHHRPVRDLALTPIKDGKHEADEDLSDS